MAKMWAEFDLTTGKPTGETLLFSDGITPEYYLNMKGGGWIMSGETCINPKKTVTWTIKGGN